MFFLNVNLHSDLAPNLKWLNLITRGNYVFMCISLDETQAFLKRTILNEVCIFSNKEQGSTVDVGRTQLRVSRVSTKLSTQGKSYHWFVYLPVTVLGMVPHTRENLSKSTLNEWTNKQTNHSFAVNHQGFFFILINANYLAVDKNSNWSGKL